jgi:outer membrane receptor for ferrienterochelin and colicins
MKYFGLIIGFCFPFFCIGQTDTIWKEIDIEEDLIVTAQYAPTHSENAVHQVKVIKGKDIQQQGLNNLAEVLTNQLNLNISVDPILGNGLKIQGIGGENVLIMIDGVPVIGRRDGNIDLSQINMNNVDRIEIIEGAMSAQYGSNASGGVINIIMKKSQLHRFQIRSLNQVENIGIQNHSLGLGFQQKKLFVSLDATRFISQFVPNDSLRILETIELNNGTTYTSKKYPWNPKIQNGLNGTVRYRFSDSTKLTYQYRYFDETLTIFGVARRPQFQPYAFDEYFTTERTDHSLNLETYIGSRFYLNSTTAFNVYDRLKRTERLDFEPDTISLVAGGQDTVTFTAFLHRSILSSVSTGKWNGQIGMEILHETGAGQQILDSTSTNPNIATLSNYAAWISTKYEPTKQLAIQANLRYGLNTKYNHPLIPSVNASWKPQKDLDFKLSYANGFRAPSLKELHFNFVDINHFIIGNPDLKAEYSQNAALNINYKKKIKKHQFKLSGKLFYNKIKNRIVLTEFEALRFNYQNLEQFETHGLNAQLNYEWKDLRLKSGYGFTRLYNEWSADFEGDRFTNLSEWQNELNYKIPFIETNLAVTHRYIGRQVRFYQNDEGELEQGFIGDYHFMNATMSRSFLKNRIFLAIGAKNLLDIQTIPFSGGSGSAHGSVGSNRLLNWGRTYFVRLNVELWVK